jgi:hypothetical protein
MRAFSLVTLIAAGCLAAPVAGAQRIETTAFAAPGRPADSLSVAKPRASGARKFWVRSFTSVVGSLAGAYGGYQLGRTYTPHRETQAAPLSSEEAVGLASGYLIGAALGAAAISFDSSCSTTERFLRGLGGALVGFIPGAVLGPLGPSMGAAAGQGRC